MSSLDGSVPWFDRAAIDETREEILRTGSFTGLSRGVRESTLTPRDPSAFLPRSLLVDFPSVERRQIEERMRRIGMSSSPSNRGEASEDDRTKERGAVTVLVDSARDGDENASDRLVGLLYEELRRLARSRLSKLPPGNTLQPTALVNEAYLRLLGGDATADWNGRGHFFGAAAAAMHQILVDQARRKASQKHGGDRQRVDLEDATPEIEPPDFDMIALDEAMTRLEQLDSTKSQLVKLRYFAGLTTREAAEILEIPLRTCERTWRYVVAWLHRELKGDSVARE